MKTLWIVLISVLVAGGLAGGGVYYYLNQKSTDDKNVLQTQITDLSKKASDAEKLLADAQAASIAKAATVTSTTPAPSAATWKTYTNSRVKYSFEYPASGLQLDLNESIKYPSVRDVDSKTEDLVQFATSTTTYSIQTNIFDQALTVEDWITGRSSSIPGDNASFPSSVLSDYTKVTIGNVTAYTHKSSLASYVVVGNKHYSIHAWDDIAPKTGSDETFSHLLSSFKFTN